MLHAIRRIMLTRLLGAAWLGTRGSAAVEMALVAPILLLLMGGGWDFGNALYQAERMASAARAGAQYGIQSSTKATDFAGMTQAARNDASDTGNSLNITASETCSCPNGGAVACNGTCNGTSPDVYVQARVATTYTTVFPYPFVTNPIPIASQVAMRVQ
jgi:Flp pilus assembly protein TadG